MGSCCAMLPCLRYRLLLTHTKQLPHTLMQRAFLGEPSGRQVVAAGAAPCSHQIGGNAPYTDLKTCTRVAWSRRQR